MGIERSAVMPFEDGSKWEGGRNEQGETHGHGKFKFADGAEYVGEFQNSHAVGRGSLVEANSSTSEMDWGAADGCPYKGEPAQFLAHGITSMGWRCSLSKSQAEGVELRIGTGCQDETINKGELGNLSDVTCDVAFILKETNGVASPVPGGMPTPALLRIREGGIIDLVVIRMSALLEGFSTPPSEYNGANEYQWLQFKILEEET